MAQNRMKSAQVEDVQYRDMSVYLRWSMTLRQERNDCVRTCARFAQCNGIGDVFNVKVPARRFQTKGDPPTHSVSYKSLSDAELRGSVSFFQC